MGVYDTVFVPCPKCGVEAEFQSKSGPCRLDEYTLDDVTPEVIMDINRHAPVECGKCKTKFKVEFKVVVTMVRSVATKEDALLDSAPAYWQT